MNTMSLRATTQYHKKSWQRVCAASSVSNSLIRGNSQLFLTAFLAHKVGTAETQQQGDAAAEGSFLIAFLVVVGKIGLDRSHHFTDTVNGRGITLGGDVTTLEHAAI